VTSLYVDDDYVYPDYAQTGIFILWGSKVIFVPKSETLLLQSVPIEIRQLNINDFRMILKDLEDDSDGMTFLDTHRHNPTVDVGGVVLARVVEIINGYSVTFEDGQYAVNLVGSNSNIADVTNVNQVSVRSANSAGLQDLASMQAASFDGGITIDVASSYSGTTFPVGTRGYPVNNLTDCMSILNARGMKQINVASALTVGSGDFSNNRIRFVGDSIHTTITIQSGANISYCEFNNLTVVGTLDNGALVKECVVSNINLVDASLFTCAVVGDVFIDGNAQCTILNCYSATPAEAVVAIDLSNAGSDHVIVVRGWTGDFRIINCSVSVIVELDLTAGRLTIESTVSNGTFNIYNGAVVVNQSSGTAVVNDYTSYNYLPEATWRASLLSNSPAGSVGEKLRKNLLR